MEYIYCKSVARISELNAEIDDTKSAIGSLNKSADFYKNSNTHAEQIYRNKAAQYQNRLSEFNEEKTQVQQAKNRS